jgi:hypothetical protein
VFTAVHLKVLKAMLYSPAGRGSKVIAGDVGFGINKTQGIINSLRDMGLIETIRYQDPSTRQPVAAIHITKAGLDAAAIDKTATDDSSHLITNNRSDSSHVIQLTEYLGYAEKEKARMEYFEFEEDRLAAAEKARAEKHRAKEEANAKKAEERRMTKRDTDPAKWTITDTAFEFAEQMHQLWHVKPWKVTTSRFRVALANARNEHGTTGPIEKVMIDLYFQQIKHNTQINDPEHIWKRFIQQYYSLMVEAQRLMITPEDVKRAKEKSMKSRERLRDV